MMMWDRKKEMGSIMARRRSSDGSVMSAPMKNEQHLSEAGEPDPRHVAAQDLHMAISEGSPEKIKEALGNFIDLHNSHRAEEDPQSESGPMTEE